MTISTEVRKAGPFIGNGSASVFPFAFKVFKAADLIVVRRQDNIGTETTLVLDSDYHVTLNGNQDTTPGGVVTLVAGALASGFTLVVSSELPYLQTTDLTNQGGFYPKVITNALDRLTIFCQQLLEITGRTLKLPITAPTNISAEIPLPNPSELIAWNEAGTGLTTVSPQSLVTSIAYGSATADLFAGDGVTTTFPLTTNPASVNNLDVSIGGHSQRPVQGGVGDYSWNGGASITFVVPPPAPTVPGDKNVLVRYMQAIPVSYSEALHAQTREALRRGYAEAGYNLVGGSFETGGTLASTTDVLLLESTGAAYAWTGALPKNVAPGFDPVGVVGFELRADVVLRDQLAGPGGVGLVGGALSQSDMVLQPITKLSSYNNADVTQAWIDSVALYGYVYFPGFSSALSAYTIPFDNASLHGTTVHVDDNVNLIFGWDYYPLIGSLNIHGNCKFTFSSKNFSTTGGKVDYIKKSASLNRFPLKASVVAFSDCTQQSISSDVWTQGSLGSTSSSAVLVPLTAGVTSGLFVPLEIGETVSAHVRVQYGTVTSIGVLLRCANGWIKLHRAPNSPGSWTYQVKQIGQSVVTGVSIPTPDNTNTLNSYSAGKASFGVSLLSRDTFRLVVNGVSGYFPIGSLVGDIYEVGFICDGASSGAFARVTGLCSYKSGDNKAFGAPPVHIAIYGDSTAEKWLSTFDRYLPQVLDGEVGSRSLSINNFAVAGETFAQQFAKLQANGPGDAWIICMVAGTNEVQSGTSADTFATQVQAFIDYCNTNSRMPMLVEPWMWYSNSFIGGKGQASSNYDEAAELREAGKRVALAGGAIYVSTTHELPAPLPSYFESGLDPLLRDDIHQSELGYRLYAELIGSHIVEYISRVQTSGRKVPSYWTNSAVVSGVAAESKITSNALSAALTVSAFTNGAVILRLPRGHRPDRPTVFTGSFAITGGTYGTCKLTYANGQITADGLTQQNSTIYIDAAW